MLLSLLIIFTGNRKLDFDEFLRYVKHTYKDPEEIKCNLTEAFKIFDANKDGFITREELKAVLTKMGEKLSEKEFDEMVRVADSNGDGRIDYEGKKMFCLLSNLIQYKDDFSLKKIKQWSFIEINKKWQRIKAQYKTYTKITKLNAPTSKAKRHIKSRHLKSNLYQRAIMYYITWLVTIMAML